MIILQNMSTLSFMMMIAGIAYAVLTFIVQRHYIHILQLEGYKNKNYFKWLKKNFKQGYLKPIIVVYFCIAYLILIVATMFLGDDLAMLFMILAVICFFGGLGVMVIYAFTTRYKDAKKPLVYTNRVIRLLVCMGIIIAVYILLMADSALNNLVMWVIVVTAPILTPFANLIMSPIEKGIQNKFLNQAKAILNKRTDLTKIGVTGSYGKTSVKFILGTILKEKYSTLVPPQSYNTPMGITRVVREQLKEEHQIFIAEMGAKNVGDIKELVELVAPQMGILTSVGMQHLETFKTLENIKNTKYELIDGLPKDTGVAFFNGDDANCFELYKSTTGIKKVLFGIENKTAEVLAYDITAGHNGSIFKVNTKIGTLELETKMLGKHNIINICGGIAIAIELGLSAKEITKGVKNIESVEHRLQIIPTTNGITVIDDAFNANPHSVLAALEVISTFENNKFVVTPGLVELGDKEAEENYKFGQALAKTATYVFLIGEKHTKPIYDGLADSGFNIDNIYVSNSLKDATQVMGHLTKAGDVILFENDLPDNYNE